MKSSKARRILTLSLIASLPLASLRVGALAEESTQGSAATDVPKVAPQALDQNKTPAASTAQNPAVPLGNPRFSLQRPEWPGRFGWGRYREYPREAELDEVLTFMKEHSPNRYAVINAYPDGPRRRGLVITAARVYRNIQRVKNENPELAKVEIKRVELEDQVFDVLSKLKEAQKAGDVVRESNLRADLSHKVGDLVDTNLKERKLRVAELEKTLAKERKQLDADSNNKQEVVAKRIDSLLEGNQASSDTDEARNDGRNDARTPGQPNDPPAQASPRFAKPAN